MDTAAIRPSSWTDWLRAMKVFCFISVAVFALWTQGCLAESLPRSLYGKSVVIQWSENRIQRDGGVGSFRSVHAEHEVIGYVSMQGRLFARMINTTGAGSAARDRGPGGGYRSMSSSFSGRAIVTIVTSTTGGNAWRITATFSPTFDSCTGEVIRAKPPGSKLSSGISPITGQLVETQSVTINMRSCSVREGNAFSS